MSDDCTKKARMASSAKDVKSPELYKGVAAEFVGTMLFLFVGVSSTFKWLPTDPQNDRMGIGAAFGFGIATAVWITAGVSGGHINPAVSVAMLVARRISFVRCILYIFAQCVGAIIGVLLLSAMTPETVGGNFGQTNIHNGVKPAAGMFYEVVITFLLVITIFGTCDPKRTDLHGSGPLAIGIAVFIAHLGAIPFTGASMNPARSLGSAVVSGKWNNFWIYWIGPLIGAIIAALVYELAFAANGCRARVRSWFFDANYDPNLPVNEYKSRVSDAEYELSADKS